MTSIKRRVDRLEGDFGKSRRAHCEGWAQFLTECGEPTTAEQMDAEIPPSVTCYEEWLHALELEEGSRHEPPLYSILLFA